MTGSRTPGSSPDLGTPERVSVVVPVRNAGSLLESQLSALAEQDFVGDWEVVIVDNGSTDDSTEVAHALSGWFRRLEVITALDRRGAAYARNAGAASARGDFLVFCDADDVVAPQWLSALVHKANDYDIVGGAVRSSAPVQSSDDGSEQSAETAELPGSSDFLPYVFSGNCGIWATTLWSLGGWDEDYLVGEDVEFSWRAQLAGYRVGFAPEAVIWRRDPTGTIALMRRSFGYGMAGARLRRDFRVQRSRGTLVEAARALGWLIVNGPRSAVSEQERRRWANVLGRRAGRLAGSVRYGVFYP